MSNVIRLSDRARQVSSVTPPVENGIDGLQSLFESWSSITLSLENLQDYLDQLSVRFETSGVTGIVCD
jgi:hypothetical protein